MKTIRTMQDLQKVEHGTVGMDGMGYKVIWTDKGLHVAHNLLPIDPLEVFPIYVAGDSALLGEALRYYAERRSMKNPKGWKKVRNLLSEAVSAHYLIAHPTEVKETFEILDALIEDEKKSKAEGPVLTIRIEKEN